MVDCVGRIELEPDINVWAFPQLVTPSGIRLFHSPWATHGRDYIIIELEALRSIHLQMSKH